VSLARLRNVLYVLFPKRANRDAALRQLFGEIDREVTPAAEQLERELVGLGHVVWRGCVQTKGAAAALGVTEEVLRDWRRRGIGPEIEPTGGRDVWYSLGAISRWRESTSSPSDF
jgi:hypothetical protein